MSTSQNAQIKIEQGQVQVDYAPIINSGDNQYFSFADNVLSGKSGYAPDVRPNGVVTGSLLLSPAASGADNAVDVAAFTAYSKGVLHTVAVTSDLTITRPNSDVSQIFSITMTDTGSIAIVEGDEGADVNFSEVRGVAGGPPELLADSLEIGQVRINSSVDVPITMNDVFQVPGQHTELAFFPTYEIDNVGKGLAAEMAAETNAHLKMAAILPTSHVGGTTKKIWVRYYTPIFVAVSRTLSYTPAETSHSVSSTPFYGGEVGSSSSSLGQGGFTAILTNGITDDLAKNRNQVLTVMFLQDRNQTPYQITQGRIGVARTFPEGDQVQAGVTISSETATADFSG